MGAGRARNPILRCVQPWLHHDARRADLLSSSIKARAGRMGAYAVRVGHPLYEGRVRRAMQYVSHRALQWYLGCILICGCLALMCQLFGPTKMRITFETEGEGAFTREEIEQIVVRDASGRVVELRLPNRLVIIANHQVCSELFHLFTLALIFNCGRLDLCRLVVSMGFDILHEHA